MIKSKRVRYFIVSMMVIAGIVIAGILAWINHTYKPTEQLNQLVKQGDYDIDGDFYVFKAKGEEKGTGIVLYPGALVEPLAYGYYADELSKDGYLVAIPKVALNLSIVDNNKAGEFIQRHKEIKDWYVGGHSMGGVSAAMYAEYDKENIRGVILLGSYPASSTDLSDDDLKVLSLYAEYDGLTSLDEIEKSRGHLPDDACFVEIAGGNHAQFGMYGEQKGDLKATVDVLTQQNEMIKATVNFLE